MMSKNAKAAEDVIRLIKKTYLLVLLVVACSEGKEAIKQGEPKVIFRPEGSNWYAGACVNFTTGKAIEEVNYAIPTGESILFGFMRDGNFVGGLYFGQDSTVGKIERRGEINGMKFDYYQNGDEGRYFFHTGLHPNTGAGDFFELYIVKGYESEMKSVLESIRIGSPVGFSLDYDSPGTVVAHPLSSETKSFVSKCNLRWDLERAFRDGFDWVGFLRDRWHDLGGNWIPLEGEPDYPDVPD